MKPSELLALLIKCSDNTTTVDYRCPALAPPPGELPLDPDAPSLWPISLGILTACCVLVTACVALRMFTRIKIVKRLFSVEDGECEHKSHYRHETNSYPVLILLSAVNLTLSSSPLTLD